MLTTRPPAAMLPTVRAATSDINPGPPRPPSRADRSYCGATRGIGTAIHDSSPASGAPLYAANCVPAKFVGRGGQWSTTDAVERATVSHRNGWCDRAENWRHRAATTSRPVGGHGGPRSDVRGVGSAHQERRATPSGPSLAAVPRAQLLCDMRSTFSAHDCPPRSVYPLSRTYSSAIAAMQALVISAYSELE